MASRNNFGSEYTQRYGSSRDDRDETSDIGNTRGSQRDDAGRYDALGNYGMSRNTSSGREHGYRDSVNERQDQTRHDVSRSSQYGAGDFRSSPYENENRGNPGYGTQYARQDGMRGMSQGTGAWGGGSYGSSEYGTNFRDSSSMGQGPARFGEHQATDRYPSRDDHYRGDRSDAWMGRSEHNSHGYHNAPSSRDASMYRNAGDLESGSMGRNRGSMPDYNTGSNFGQSQQPYGRNHVTGYGSEHRDGGYNRYGSATDRSWQENNESAWDDIRNRGSQMMHKVGEFFGVGPKGYTRSDSRIQEDVSDVLTDDQHIDATHIEVQVKSGEVTLEGFVSDRWAKRHAEDLAHGCRGVTEVHNRLRTRPMSAATASDVSATSGLPQASTSMTSGLKTESGDKKADRNHKQIS